MYFCLKLPSASSWGCELKWCALNLCGVRDLVSLFVRLWVEMTLIASLGASCLVSLFVRLWVEITYPCHRTGCCQCQPLREAVSWNFLNYADNLLPPVSLFVRLWVEMTRKLWDLPRSTVSLFVRLWVEISIWEHIQQILLSASSWGCELKCQSSRSNHPRKASASSWGCELKWYMLHEAYSSK